MAESLRIGVLHGPNLNLLGRREPEIYGDQTLDDINAALEREAKALGVGVECFQSNHEGALVDWLQSNEHDGYVVNAASLTHTSVALRDALKFCGVPFVEVHISNVFAREEFRHRSYLSDLAVGVITGLGPEGYVYGLRGLVKKLVSR